jgi:hypothetical protein
VLNECRIGRRGLLRIRRRDRKVLVDLAQAVEEGIDRPSAAIPFEQHVKAFEECFDIRARRLARCSPD